MAPKTHDCKVSCTGLYADMWYKDDAPTESKKNDFDTKGNKQKIFSLTKSYNDYKSNYARNLKFDAEQANSSVY